MCLCECECVCLGGYKCVQVDGLVGVLAKWSVTPNPAKMLLLNYADLIFPKNSLLVN